MEICIIREICGLKELERESKDRFLQVEQLYQDVIKELNALVPTIPALRQTDNMKEHPAILHYFRGGTDIFICEYDGQDDMFGFGILNNDSVSSEWGYFYLEEIRRVSLMNIDYYWEPQTIEIARYKLYPHYFKKP